MSTGAAMHCREMLIWSSTGADRGAAFLDPFLRLTPLTLLECRPQSGPGRCNEALTAIYMPRSLPLSNASRTSLGPADQQQPPFRRCGAGRNPDLSAAVKALIEQQAAAKAGAGGAAQAEADAHLDPLEGIDLAPLHRWGR